MRTEDLAVRKAATDRSLVIDHLRYSAADTQHPVIHIYFDYRDQQHQTIERIVASLLKQLASSCLRLPTAVTALHKRLSEQEKTPQHQDLLLALTILCREQKKVFLVIDALDECDPSVRKELCGFLRTPVSHCIRTFVTSRYHPADIREFFSECPQIEIKADSSDLQMYMRHEIECSDWRGDIDDRLTEKIAITIVESAKDM